MAQQDASPTVGSAPVPAGAASLMRPGNPPSVPDPGSAYSAPSISLPRGGRGIRGIGETIVANPVAGTWSLSVPLAPLAAVGRRYEGALPAPLPLDTQFTLAAARAGELEELVLILKCTVS